MFGKKVVKQTYDPGKRRPVLRCSICTGEQVAGFKNLETGQFEEIMLISSERDLKKFKEMYSIEEIAKEY